MNKTYKDIKVTAQEAREALKKEFPACKFSVTIERYSGGRLMTISLMEAPFEVFEPNEKLHRDGYAQLSHHTFKNETEAARRQSNGIPLTAEAFTVLKRACEIGLKDHWDDSDSMTDYFSCAYYFNIHIGRWDKPFQVTAPAKKGLSEVMEPLAKEISFNAFEASGEHFSTAQITRHADAVNHLEKLIQFLKFKGPRPFTNDCDVLQLIKESLSL